MTILWNVVRANIHIQHIQQKFYASEEISPTKFNASYKVIHTRQVKYCLRMTFNNHTK